MEAFSRYLGINGILSLCCVFWIFSPAEGNPIFEAAGSRVILPCNETNSTLHQLTWRMNGLLLISFKPPEALYITKEAESLKMNISLSETQQYTLVIDRVQKSHTGNYTCDSTTSEGVLEQKWELIITGHEENWNKLIPVAVIVSCVCCLIFIIAWIILRRIYNRHAENGNQSHTAEMAQSEDIYENCLEINVRQQQNNQQPHYYKTRAC
ncbi:uncharacterized protein LOC111218653 [Seriola dumerili]|uniref:uncharacterized protein LOC111218653 n=1 Tax=Seriola dumerili TaxID=41447 RepID=UPI000BBECB08|nr:uncharacterized protein LOC111218653 [Seriola dumerili]XP_022596778.1 uncharacterized protein LOC111218653 [Seriola dumerili]